MAGTVTQTCKRVYSTEGGPSDLYLLTFAWTADASAATIPATVTTDAITAMIAGKWLIQAVTNPGTTAPTADYDITLTDADGLDVMGGTLANRHTSNTEVAIPYPGSLAYAPVPITSALTLTITNNSVNSATGTVVITLSR